MSKTYIYVSVSFQNDVRFYYYRTYDASIKSGDLVLVPVEGSTPKPATVLTSREYTEANVPYPVNKTKAVIGRIDVKQLSNYSSDLTGESRNFTNEEAVILINKYQQLLNNGKREDDFFNEYETAIKNIVQNNKMNSVCSKAVVQYIQNDMPLEYKTPETQQLINNVYIWRKAHQRFDRSIDLRQSYDKQIKLAVDHLSVGTGGIKWFFSSKNNKKLAIKAFEFLNSQVHENYLNEVSNIPEVLKDLRLMNVSNKAWNDFEEDKKEYEKIIKQISSISDLSGSQIPELDYLYKQYCQDNDEYSRVKAALDQYEKDIIQAAQYMRNEEVVRILKTIPIEEINRDHSGIRVKALRDAGYETLADIAVADTYQLSRIYGISQEAADIIKNAANEIYSRTFNTTRIRINLDNQTKSSTKLVCTIARYKPFFHDLRSIEQQKSMFYKDIDSKVESLRKMGGGLSWLFLDYGEIDNYKSDYLLLRQFVMSDWGSKVRDVYNKIRNFNDTVDANYGWSSFKSDPVTFNLILENLIPDLVRNDSSYGLPEELAREIEEEVFFPDGFTGTLYGYQEWGVKYILHQGKVLLGDEMGLGKTIQAIVTMVSLRNTGATHFMVVCPASVLENWCREIVKFSKLRPIKVHGQLKNRAMVNWLKNGGVAVTTYETTESIKLLQDRKINLLVIDEAHYIKNPDAKRSKNVKKISENAERLLLMTGTALENKVEEMIVLINYLNPLLAGELSRISFMSTAPQFREKVASVYFRRKREQVLEELPELTEEDQWCELNAAEKEAYEKAVLLKKYSEARRVSWNVDINKSSKAQRLLELVNEAADEGRNVIVFSFFLETMNMVRQLIGNKYYGLINGAVSPEKRQIIIEGLAKQEGKVLLAQIIAGGVGLNIQSASVVIFCEPQLKPSLETQAIARSHRLGQGRNVLVYRLLCSKSIDERIMDMLKEKQAVFNAFADKSVAAEKAGDRAVDPVEIDRKSFGKLIEEEIERINKEKGRKSPANKSEEVDAEFEDEEDLNNEKEITNHTERSKIVNQTDVRNTIYFVGTNQSYNSGTSGRPMYQMSLDNRIVAEYSSVAEAARVSGVNSKSIRDAANGVQRTAGGYKWKYKDQYSFKPLANDISDYQSHSNNSAYAQKTYSQENKSQTIQISGKLIKDLEKYGFELIDNRKQSNVLWVIYKNKEQFEEIMRQYNCKYSYEFRGAIATNGRRAWRIMGYRGE